MPEMFKPEIAEKSREELQAIIYALMNKIRELEAEIIHLKQPPSTSRNSSQPPSRDFKADQTKKGRRRKKAGAKAGHEKAERVWWLIRIK